MFKKGKIQRNRITSRELYQKMFPQKNVRKEENLSFVGIYLHLHPSSVVILCWKGAGGRELPLNIH